MTTTGANGPADALEIRDDLEKLIDSTRRSDAHPILKTAAFPMLFENVHPFADGNGRTGRQLLNLMLMESGYQPIAIEHAAGRAYGRSLERWQAYDDPAPFLSPITGRISQEQGNIAAIIERIRYGEPSRAADTGATMRPENGSATMR